MPGRLHGLVLAAGRGSRLAPCVDNRPKWLLSFGQDQLASRHVAAFASLPDEIRGQLIVVKGHCSEMIDDYVSTLAIPTISVFNSRYEDRNNWYSLLVALRALGQLKQGDAVAVLNADLYAESGWIADCLVRGYDLQAPSLVVDQARALTDEAMKVSTDADDGALANIGKTGVADASGEYVGLLFLTPDAVRVVMRILEDFEQDPTRSNEWYEAAVRASTSSLRWQLLPTPDGRWVEIDDCEDYAAAQRLADGAP